MHGRPGTKQRRLQPHNHTRPIGKINKFPRISSQKHGAIVIKYILPWHIDYNSIFARHPAGQDKLQTKIIR